MPASVITAPPIAVPDKDARSVLKREDTLHVSYIVLEGRLWLLDDADVVAILDKNVVDAFQPEPSAQAP